MFFIMQVLYEDNHLIAVYKPAGMLVQGDEIEDRSLMDEVKDYLKQKYQKPGNVFLGLLHRLDRPVAGIVLFAKTSKGAALLSAQIRERTIEKIYHALVVGVPEPPNGTLVHYLQKDHNKNIVTAHRQPKPGALRAELDYEVISSLFQQKGGGKVGDFLCGNRRRQNAYTTFRSLPSRDKKCSSPSDAV